MPSGLVWESVNWRCGNDHYLFEIERGGLFATLEAPGERHITLPMTVWEGLLDALKANRATRRRSDRDFPARSGARWSDGETAELVDGFKAGQPIAQLARVHNRTTHAIEHQLDKMGLISTAQIHGPNRVTYVVPSNQFEGLPTKTQTPEPNARQFGQAQPQAEHQWAVGTPGSGPALPPRNQRDFPRIDGDETP